MVDTLARKTKNSESTRIVFDLEARIVEGTLAGGFRLIERVLCSEYGVSRTVVREALLKLASRGLIILVPDAGATVVPLVESKVRDAFIFREAIESAAAEQCAARMNREEAEALLAIAAQFGAEYDRRARGEPSRIHDLEEEFHRSVVEGSKNDFFINNWQQAKLCLFRGVRVQPEELLKPEKREISVDDHLAIARAIAAGQAEEAGLLMRRHLRSGRDLMIQNLKN